MRRLLLLLVVSWCSLAVAAPSAKARGKKAQPGAATPAAAPATLAAPAPAAPPPARSGPGADPSVSSTALLAEAKNLYDSLEYDQVIPAATAVLAREDLTLDQRLEAYRLQGCAKAIVEDPVDAEKPFRLLLRARTDYDLPAGTPPKILAVFRKVQTEELALGKTLREVERARMIAGLRLLGDPPKEAKGGKPLSFSFRLRDPNGAVDAVRLPYRRAGQKAFSSLALERSESGDWRGAIPAEFTADEKGFTLEYYVETTDAAGPLLSRGTQAKPESLPVLAGLLVVPRARPIPRWAFLGAAALTAVSGLAWAGTGSAFNYYQGRYAAGARSGTTMGSVLRADQQSGELFARFANVSGIAFAAALVATIVLWPFTQFSADEG